MDMHESNRRRAVSTVVLSVGLPTTLIAVILWADHLEGPKTAYVGVLAAVPLLAAVFGTPASTALVSVIAWLSALTFGHFAIDGTAPAQTVRLVIIALFGALAVLASLVRQRRDAALASATAAAAGAEQDRVLATHDALTGMLNRRGFLDTYSMRPDAPSVCLVVLDCDNFKGVNDRFGHAVGDEYLAAAAQRITGSLSEGDQVSRWGGDEFLVALELSVEDTRRVVERLRCTVMANPISTSAGALPLTLSAGIAAWRPDEGFSTALARADHAMYAAKHDGRNMTVIARTDARRAISV